MNIEKEDLRAEREFLKNYYWYEELRKRFLDYLKLQLECLNQA